MDLVKDAYVLRLVEQISEHYRTNISNRFIRTALMQLSLDKETWDLLETLTEKFEQFRYHGFHLDELYLQIAAAAKFIDAARTEIAPTLRRKLDWVDNSSDKVLRDMAVNNFMFNLQLLADLLSELFIKLAEIDTAAAKGKQPIYRQIAGLAEFGLRVTGL